MPLDAFHVRAERFAVATTTGKCWSCQATTDVACLVVGAGHRESDDAEQWDSIDEPSVLNNILDINTEALAMIKQIAPCLAMRTSMTAGETYLGNGCSECGVLQGDHYLKSEPGTPFWPEPQQKGVSIKMLWIELPIELACGGKSMGVQWMN